nr:immunoglobulin light chain junction region [Macaca mulatta]
CMIWYNNAYIF